MHDDRHSLETIDSLRRNMTLGAAATTLMSLLAPSALAQSQSVTLEGVEIPGSVMAYGQRLVLNGAGVRKRGYFKADVTALYLPQKMTSADDIYKLNGIRRIQLNILRRFTSSTISRIFLADFKDASTPEEFRRMIGPLGQIGAAYANVKEVVKGDVVNLDWVPGKGWLATHNGRSLNDADGAVLEIKDELAYQIYMRMYIGDHAQPDLRNALLGVSKS